MNGLFYAIYPNGQSIKNETFERLEKIPDIVYIHKYYKKNQGESFDFIDKEGEVYQYNSDNYIIIDIGYSLRNERYNWREKKYNYVYHIELGLRSKNDLDVHTCSLTYDGSVSDFYNKVKKMLEDIESLNGFMAYVKIEELNNRIDWLERSNTENKCDIADYKKRIEELEKEISDKDKTES